MRDGSRFKLAVKATQIGYSFAAALEAVLDCLEHRTLWIVLSRGERQSLEFMQKVCDHVKALQIIGPKLETSAFFANGSVLQHEIQFPTGSRIIGLPANPDTARGYTGNMILDEFAFHQHDREIWAAAFGRISRGDLKLRVISTPNGCRGKYYELAKEVGLVEPTPSRDREGAVATPSRDREGAVAPRRVPRIKPPLAGARGSDQTSPWSGHWCDVHAAVRQGCPMDVKTLRPAVGDEETWQQEYECAFLSGSENYIPLDLILACQDPQATAALPSEFSIRNSEFRIRNSGVGSGEWGMGKEDSEFGIQNSEFRELYFGYDVARVRDLAVLAVVEKVGDVFWTRALIEMPGATFSVQEQALRDIIPHCARGAVDSTGLGMQMAERLAQKFPGQVEPVTFTAARKQDLAIRMKRHFEERSVRIPDHRELRRDLNAVKRMVTAAGNIRFDAERTDQGHADRFWALALALHAADQPRRPAVASGGIESDGDWYHPSRDREEAVKEGPFATENLDGRLLTRAARTVSTGEIAWA
ncbi:MAG: hypothetical protein A3J28_11435 [Acidobacteria bacterium RIFCSPLOWO2_12_FULL_60_22]|nr:MAG: hypothetical protein A3J28_11435 [Acidobacteria bacterium RIFCSPLOWO2_12_FULL_60_22]